MIWLTWRQHRKQALFAVIGLAALAAFMVPTGRAMRDAFARLGLAECLAARGGADLIPGNVNSEACHLAMNQFNNEYAGYPLIGVLFLVLPLLVGLFWGAPLVAREVEHGTHRLVWTQGISRRHWALVKIAIVGAGALMVSVGYGLGMSWWLDPLMRAGGRIGRFMAFFFDMQGVVPIGYTVFAVALGIAAGTLWPKVVPAMAATLVGFVGTRIAVAWFARPRFLPARELTYPITQSNLEPNTTLGNWVISYGIRDASGTMIAPNSEIVCPPNATGPGAGCGANLGVSPDSYNWQLYQPGERYWLFQWIELGLFVALAAALLYLAIRRIRRLA
jgi:hypothetical protein